MTHHESEIGCLHRLYEAGTATEAEEQRLRMLLAKADAATLPPELRLLRRMFDGLAALAAETVPAAALRKAASVPLRRDVRPLRRIAGWGAVAAVVAPVSYTHLRAHETG